MQLDIFEDCRDVMLRNDVLAALGAYQALTARRAWQTLHGEYPQDDLLPSLLTLLLALEEHAPENSAQRVFESHENLRQARVALQDSIRPAAQRVFSAAAAELWLRPFWQDLVQRAVHLPFRADCEDDHTAPMLLHLKDWQGAVDALARIPSWRRIPAPLAWMTQARLGLLGLQSSWGLLAELAWLAPKRLDALLQHAPDPLLQRLKDQFDAGFDAALDTDGAQTDPTADWAWFPAWVLCARPDWVSHLASAQPGQHRAPEQAMRLMVELLGLERQGRHHDIVAHRKRLRALHPGLYAAYMKTR